MTFFLGLVHGVHGCANGGEGQIVHPCTHLPQSKKRIVLPALGGVVPPGGPGPVNGC